MSGQARVSLGGSPLEEAILLQVKVNQCLNQHWFAEVECRDTLDHPIPGEDVLGQPCQISTIDDDGIERLSFAGFVIDVEVRREVWGSQSAVIRAASPSWAMDRSRRNAYFATGALASIAGQLAGGLPLSCVLGSASSLQEHIQYGETDWRFLLRLADDAGGWVRAGLGSIELRSGFDDPHPLPFRKEGGLLEFFIDGTLPATKVRAAHYDTVKAQSRVWDGQARSASFEAGGARMGAAVADGAAWQGLAGSTGRSRAASLDAMAERASAEAERAHGAAVVAGGVSRDTGVVAGGSLAIKGAASMEEASGTWYVLEVKHLWTRQGYENKFTATPWSGWRGWARPQPQVAPGPQAARVVANHDPENRGRVRVQLYWQGGGPLLWAPVASAHAGAGFGLMTTPEVGDEVLVGFLDSDPERPVVLGSVWNGLHQPPATGFQVPGEINGSEFASNDIKRLVTKSGIRIQITDTPGKQAISLATPRSNHLLLSEQVAETGRPAIVLHTLGDIHLSAGGRIHRQSLAHSHHVDGKIMHPIVIRLNSWHGDSALYQNVKLNGGLTDGSSADVQIAHGQHFPSIPQGNCTFHFPDFYDAKPSPAPEGVS